MKRIAGFILIASILVACGQGEQQGEEGLSVDLIDNPNSASNQTEEDMLPYFEFVEEVIDFGQITQGEVVSTAFRFKNVGRSDLIISSAQGSCGCTVPEWPKEPIKPGAEATIKVTFNSNGKSGKQNKTVTLVANTIPNTKVIALKGEVLVPEKK
ncbi:MAG: DUF1573 domain-containing protein [Flavobacteriales bacterium]|nr:DUF1573 domain-containing protein [Flavobacteriales bacterium]